MADEIQLVEGVVGRPNDRLEIWSYAKSGLWRQG